MTIQHEGLGYPHIVVADDVTGSRTIRGEDNAGLSRASD